MTVYPGKGQVEPKVYFGSGPTKKDAKFACGSVAWADIGAGTLGGVATADDGEVAGPSEVLPLATPDDPAQAAVLVSSYA